MRNYEIKQIGSRWYVMKRWWRAILDWPFGGSFFISGTGPGDERAVGFISKEIAEAAIRKFPEGKLIVDFPQLREAGFTDSLLTEAGQRALLN